MTSDFRPPASAVPFAGFAGFAVKLLCIFFAESSKLLHGYTEHISLASSGVNVLKILFDALQHNRVEVLLSAEFAFLAWDIVYNQEFTVMPVDVLRGLVDATRVSTEGAFEVIHVSILGPEVF